ncbi:hypothetical protein FRX31_032893 [Thalictrum thalictroides]|uniref:Uncharacterized protein n=1 Tax=Thalictrum thalictroides TaxID=46969 RepID=A0A7J6UY19_THATH|nr:hypothetical protein FRX31_032893 [Thalictrum thalictroides]
MLVEFFRDEQPVTIVFKLLTSNSVRVNGSDNHKPHCPSSHCMPYHHEMIIISNHELLLENLKQNQPYPTLLLDTNS